MEMESDRTVTLHDALGHDATLMRRDPEVRWVDATGRTMVRAVRGRAIVGSAPDADIVIEDKAVSRLHTELDRREDGLWARDLGSRNGTYLENIQIDAARVPEGGRLQLGRTELTVTYVTKATAVELWPEERFGELLGSSAPMREFFSVLARIAQTNATVLLEGETGTGKELAARAIHDASPRCRGPFVIIDCGALPESLLEAELFGHAKGAYTGAAESRAGALEAANGGTVFLDEIGELSLGTQPKLLRALESRAVKRLGETHHRPIDVRFVSATHRDLRTMVNARAFREDLYFRLATIPITIPPLRKRLSDIPALVRHFLPPDSSGFVTPELMRELLGRPWYGNVRELRNFVERAAALGASRAFALDATHPNPLRDEAGWQPHLPERLLELPLNELRELVRSAVEREYLEALLQRYNRNIADAAQGAGLNRTYLHRLVAKHSL